MKTLAFLGLNFFILLLIANGFGIKPIAFFNLKALCIVFAPQILIVFFSHEKHQIIPFLKRVFYTHTNESDELILQRMVTLGMVQGLMGGFLGVIHVMSHLEDPWQIGKGFALMLICLFYGLYPTTLLLFRLKQSIQEKLGGYMLLALPLMFFSIYLVFKGLETKPSLESKTIPANQVAVKIIRL